jgi:hypothetical protein
MEQDLEEEFIRTLNEMIANLERQAHDPLHEVRYLVLYGPSGWLEVHRPRPTSN